MKEQLRIENISDQVILFLRKHYDTYNRQSLALELQISSPTLSRRIYMNDWRTGEIKALKRIFASKGYELIGEVKNKVKIKWNEPTERHI